MRFIFSSADLTVVAVLTAEALFYVKQNLAYCKAQTNSET